MNPSKPAPTADASRWDQRYRQGADGWELGRAAPPLELFLRNHPLAPQPPGPVLVPGCGHGHEADLFDRQALEAAGLAAGSMTGIVEHTCFCAIDPGRRDDYIATVCRLLAPGGCSGATASRAVRPGAVTPRWCKPSGVRRGWWRSCGSRPPVRWASARTNGSACGASRSMLQAGSPGR